MEEYKSIKSLKNIEKSIEKYILKDILFSFLSEKQKLNIIIYNKQLQKKFGINIENYKKLSGKFKIGKKDGRGKVY